ncbi:hypothetical protein CEUSTIGMA_g6802.t1 [Chlamydomonas eustigma]|uniref:Uncharacterized protein n=1 Tax=Chlamydomonas eustigma TaxID=1157962 RepID=A0A250X9B5_9CHLO|nr:hypothetical protein CEUSTIGMA_g6802.t1 [Chlamydomonas eustigma]|eukprot:GAX79360.1 hypothetical protein CEUSTIGMA_g6802.t1 [Chlamydomonas eustigma]
MLRDWLTVLRSDDIEAIKLLKRQLLVHTGEGNANATDELLCHPLLRIYLAMLMHREQGQLQQALRLEVQLKELAVRGVARAAEFEWEEQHGLHNIDLGDVRLNHIPQLREDSRANS